MKITIYLKNVFERNRFNIYCIAISLSVYALNQFFLKQNTEGIIGYFCKCHLNDLMCSIFILGFLQILIKWTGVFKDADKIVLVIGMIMPLVWEYFAPLINPNSVSDLWDILTYYVGIMIYYFIRYLIFGLKCCK